MDEARPVKKDFDRTVDGEKYWYVEQYDDCVKFNGFGSQISPSYGTSSKTGK